MNAPAEMKPEEKLEKLLAEGKISREQYDECRLALKAPEALGGSAPVSLQTGPPRPSAPAPVEPVLETSAQSGIPWQVWVCAAIFVITGVGPLFSHKFSTVGALAALVIGPTVAFFLVRRRRWAFIVGVVMGGVAVVGTVLKGNGSAAFLNLLITALLASSIDWYYGTTFLARIMGTLRGR